MTTGRLVNCLGPSLATTAAPTAVAVTGIARPVSTTFIAMPMPRRIAVERG